MTRCSSSTRPPLPSDASTFPMPGKRILESGTARSNALSSANPDTGGRRRVRRPSVGHGRARSWPLMPLGRWLRLERSKSLKGTGSACRRGRHLSDVHLCRSFGSQAECIDGYGAVNLRLRSGSTLRATPAINLMNADTCLRLQTGAEIRSKSASPARQRAPTPTFRRAAALSPGRHHRHRPGRPARPGPRSDLAACVNAQTSGGVRIRSSPRTVGTLRARTSRQARDDRLITVAQFEFEVLDVFDIPQRHGLIVVGTVRHGTVRSGVMLRDAATGDSFRLMGVDLVRGRDRDGGGFGLVVSRDERAHAQPGRIWITDED